MIERLKIELGFRKPDYLTHTPSLAKVGNISNDGKRITHVKELIPTALNNGGRSRCWGVFTSKDIHEMPVRSASILIKSIETSISGQRRKHNE